MRLAIVKRPCCHPAKEGSRALSDEAPVLYPGDPQGHLRNGFGHIEPRRREGHCTDSGARQYADQIRLPLGADFAQDRAERGPGRR